MCSQELHDFVTAWRSVKGAKKQLSAALLTSPLGSLVAIADEGGLYMLEFLDRKGLEKKIERLCLTIKAELIVSRTAPIDQLDKELSSYFLGENVTFSSPLSPVGSDFQLAVWQSLREIPLGETRSYADIARCIGRPKACRAVARANASNSLAIVIPCHRVINSNGELGGYAGGLQRKQALLELEESH